MQALTLIAKWLMALVACVLLDYATFTPPLAPLGITPWNPSIGLAVAIVLVGGRRFAPLMALAPFISDLVVRALPFPWWVSALEAALIGAGYYVGLQVLARPAMAFDRKLHRLRDLLPSPTARCSWPLGISIWRAGRNRSCATGSAK
jgi:two-component system, LuxR family, sensor kinase FixL